MKPIIIRICVCFFLIGFFILLNLGYVSAQPIVQDSVINEKLVYHPIHLNVVDQTILPWYSSNLGVSYDHVLGLVWQYWQNLPECFPGVKWYLMHRQVIVSNSNFIPKGGHDDGIGGDQIAMAMSSWRLYYAYTGDENLIKDMVYMADYYLENGLSSPDCKWPDFPFACNPGREHNMRYSGDWVVDLALYKEKQDREARKEAMKNGEGYLQPDKAGSFAYELVHLYKMTGDVKYLEAAVKIANTLAKFTVKGDKENSPLPFRVQAKTGEIYPQTSYVSSTFTSNWTATIMLFDELNSLNKGNTASYNDARRLFITFLKDIVVKNDLYGPFFEDIPMWSNTQINALTIGRYILMKKDEWGENWRDDVRKILDWSTETFRHDDWKKYGVVAIGEQTVYNEPGNGHTARQASVELLYCAETSDSANKDSAIRQLNWATYMVDIDGKNCYPNNEIWLTDGYGDYVRHFIRAMSAFPELAPDNANHLLKSTSTVQKIKYEANKVAFTTFDNHSEVTLRLSSKPNSITVSGKALKQLDQLNGDGYIWNPMEKGGVVKLKFSNGQDVNINL